MEYTLKDATWVGTPTPKKDDPTKIQVWVNVITGIVGDTYNFVRTDQTVMEFPMSMTGTQMEAETQVKAAAFVATKYPNT